MIIITGERGDRLRCRVFGARCVICQGLTSETSKAKPGKRDSVAEALIAFAYFRCWSADAAIM